MEKKQRLHELVRGHVEERIEPISDYDEAHAAEVHRLIYRAPQDLSEIHGARGRIAEPRPDGRGVTYNRAQRVDGVRFRSYDRSTGAVRVRIDNGDTPSFWLEFDLPVRQLLGYVDQERQAADAEADEDAASMPASTPPPTPRKRGLAQSTGVEPAAARTRHVKRKRSASDA